MRTLDGTPIGPAPDELAVAAGQAVVELRGAGLPGSLVGGKAAALDRLIGWGLPVPPTAVVTAQAFRAVSAQPAVEALLTTLHEVGGIEAAAVDAAFAATAIQPAIADEIVAAGRRVAGGGRLAIRSSATVEDLASSSFAGQYHSVLDIDPSKPDDVLDAVKSVWASLYHPSACAYRAAVGMADEHAAMAVVMMPMVNAVRAGVAFTQDPTVGDGLMRIEYVTGLAEGLVAGRATPSVVVIERAGVDPALPAHVRRVAELAMAIERRAGCPQDIEWAFDGAQVWIVQARPITVGHPQQTPHRGAELDVVGAVELTTAGIAEMLPGVLAPLSADLGSLLVEEALRRNVADLGGLRASDADALAERAGLVRWVRGRAALDLHRLAGAVAGVAGAEARIRTQYFGETAGGAAGRRAPNRLSVVEERLRAARLRRRATFDADMVAHAVGHLADAPDGMTDRTLLSRHVRFVDAAMRGMAAEMTVAADAHAVIDGLRAVLAKYLPPDRAAHHAFAITVPSAVPPIDRFASAAVFAGPTWAELDDADSPASCVAIGPPDRERHVDELASELSASDSWPASAIGRWVVERRIDRLATEATHQLERRERTKSAVLRLGGELRRLHLEVGRRLVARGSLSDVAEVELLTVRELRAALLTGVVPEPAAIRARLAEHRHHQQGPPLPLRVTADVLASTQAPAPRTGEELKGWPVSGGCFVGTARPADGPLADVGSDEVLVAVTTDPSWSPLLMRCRAIVIEQGGPLSHAAILAREFGVPAVFNIPGAVARLAGRRIEVDGDRGVVTILDREDA